jgi:glycosyltransferase involved in cell wall biosynthesis
MRFSIVTPSFRSSQWLRLCIASVADQEGVELEHIVQDSCSDDGTGEWLPSESRVKAFIERDQGMYDAINRGFKRSSGEILAYLNCDEQLLPGALKPVHDCFAADPGVDVVLSDTVVTDSDGNYICHRYSLVPKLHQIWVRCPAMTCALFVRRRVITELGVWLDTRWRALGDMFWLMDMLKKRTRIKVLRRFTSIFTDTGDNMMLKPNAIRERHLAWEMTPRCVKLLQYPLIFQYRARLIARGSLWQEPFSYALYTLSSPSQRVVRRAENPTSMWTGRTDTIPKMDNA